MFLTKELYILVKKSSDEGCTPQKSIQEKDWNVKKFTFYR